LPGSWILILNWISWERKEKISLALEEVSGKGAKKEVSNEG
jgi:hypothetical protein